MVINREVELWISDVNETGEIETRITVRGDNSDEPLIRLSMIQDGEDESRRQSAEMTVQETRQLIDELTAAVNAQGTY